MSPTDGSWSKTSCSKWPVPDSSCAVHVLPLRAVINEAAGLWYTSAAFPEVWLDFCSIPQPPPGSPAPLPVALEDPYWDFPGVPEAVMLPLSTRAVTFRRPRVIDD